MILSWIAIIILAFSYYFQIYKIQKHKEVRDLSLPYHIFLALGFGILTYQAYLEGSTIFIVKQIATTVPVLILIGQILYHRKDSWHDDDDLFCKECGLELEKEWDFCPFCGEEVE